MSRLKQHYEESERLFRNPFREAPIWLDAYSGAKEYRFHHRKKRHPMEGIWMDRELFGKTASPAAKRHIVSDLKEEGRNTEKYRFPKNERDNIEIGLF